MICSIVLTHWLDILVSASLLGHLIYAERATLAQATATVLPWPIPSSETKATVVREGKKVEILSRELVPGDIISLHQVRGLISILVCCADMTSEGKSSDQQPIAHPGRISPVGVGPAGNGRPEYDHQRAIVR